MTEIDPLWKQLATPPVVEPGTAGQVEASVRADLVRLGTLEEGVRGTLAQMALRMARAYDQYDGVDLTKLARLNQELRQTLAALVGVGDVDDSGEAARMSTPVWDEAQPRPADAGSAGRRGSGKARPAADAAPAGDRGRRV
jgi:hypothetical protein